MKNITMPLDADLLPGRPDPIAPNKPHFVLGTSLVEYPIGTEIAMFGMGCFWGVERLFWMQEGVFVTVVGYAGGKTPNPLYEEVCTGLTGHNEVVLVVYWPDQISYQSLLKLFWEGHNPTLGMRQGNDIGTQYRSGIYCSSTHQKQLAEESKQAYQQLLEHERLNVSTEIQLHAKFYFAESYHQQYLAKNPNGYCNLQTTNKTGLPIFSMD